MNLYVCVCVSINSVYMETKRNSQINFNYGFGIFINILNNHIIYT